MKNKKKTYIEEYYDWIKKNPKKVNRKIKIVYKKLVEDIKKPRQVSFLNNLTGENEKHTYIYDDKRATLPIEFIEKFCKHSKRKMVRKTCNTRVMAKGFYTSPLWICR